MEIPLQLNREKVTSILGIVAATTLVCSVLSVSLRKKKTKGTKEIPVPDSCYPYVGHLLSLGDLPHQTISDWHKKYGPIINLKMGIQNWVSISDRYLAHELYVQNGSIFFGPPDSLFARLYSHNGRGVLFSEKKHWKNGRERCRSILAPKMIDRFMDGIEFEVADLCNRLVDDSEKEGSVYPTPYLQLSTLNIILNITMGKRFESLDDPELSEIMKMLKANIYYEGIEMDLPNYLPILSVLNLFSNVGQEMRDHFSNSRDRIIKRLMAESAEKEEINFVKAINEEDSILDDTDKLVLLCDILEAGQETLESILVWSFAILCGRPEIQIKMQDEIDRFIKTNGRIPSFTDRESCPYCVSTIKECLRYRSPTPFGGSHVITKDAVISGYFIPEGSTVITSMDAINLSTTDYKDAEKFSPERFMHDTRTMAACANGKVEERDHLSFGWGRHICPGIYLAESEIFSTFMHIFVKCTVKPTVDANGSTLYPDIDTSVNAGSMIVPKPYQVKFVRRENALV